MTARQEAELLNGIRALKKELAELKAALNPVMPKVDEYLNAAEAGKILGFTPRHVRRMIEDGRIPFATKVGREWRISKIKLLKYIERI